MDIDNKGKGGKTKVLTSPYKPRALQQLVHDLAEKYRFMVIVCHRRWGKSVFAINQIIFSLLKNKNKRPQYVYIGPEKTQTKKIIWEYVKEFTSFIPGVKVYEAELKVEIPLNQGSGFIFLEGAENPDRLRGNYYDGVVLDEVAQMPKSIWTQIVRPALSDRGGWAMFIGTPKGRNYFKELYNYQDNAELNKYNEWKSIMFKASESKVIPQSELDSARITLGEAMYHQEYECSFDAVIEGSYYGEFLENAKLDNRIGDFSWNKDYPVTTSFDIGVNDRTSIWFAQQIGNKVYIIDFFEDNNKGLPEYVKILKSKPYVYDKHIFPHDLKQTSWGTGNTSLDDVLNLLGNNIVLLPKFSIEDGINAARSVLSICYFNEKKCYQGLDCLSNYKSKYDDKNDVQRLVPVHDWSSHAADSFRYLALGIKEAKYDRGSRFGKPSKIRNWGDSWNPLS